MSRDTEKAKFVRTQIERCALHLDRCSLTYGVAPCTASGATGEECYNTFQTCQDQPNYAKTTQTITFCHRGGLINHGEDVRPYVTSINTAPTKIEPGKGLAVRGKATVQLIDEPSVDVLDPYRSTRADDAGGTFLARLVARNLNYYGRTATLIRGFATEPFSLDAVREEEYIIDTITGPDADGRVSITLADRIKLLDSVKLPAPSKGKLAADCAAYEFIGFVRSGGSTSIQLAESANTSDDYYNGMEVYVFAGDGAGQRRVITDYVGETRTATISAAWSVNPSSNSSAEVAALSVTLTDATGYASSGYVRIGDEVIRYTGKSGNVLSWPDATYRAQFGTDRIDHKTKDAAQQCLVFESTAPYAAVKQILNDAGITDASIDTAGLAQEFEDWANSGNITACIATPETASALIADLLQDFGIDLWWDAVEAKVKGKANAPTLDPDIITITDDVLLKNKTQAVRDESARITQSIAYYEPRSATADKSKPETYLSGEIYIDSDAESANEYSDVRQSVRYSRWMTADNGVLVAANVARKLMRLRNAPVRFSFELDYRDELTVGQVFYIRTRRYVGFDGQPKLIKCRAVEIDDTGKSQNVKAISTGFNKRYGFIAPSGFPDYNAATDAQRLYAFISPLSTGDDGYYIS